MVVDKLFGLYNYTLAIPSTAEDKVFIIYGDIGDHAVKYEGFQKTDDPVFKNKLLNHQYE